MSPLTGTLTTVIAFTHYKKILKMYCTKDCITYSSEKILCVPPEKNPLCSATGIVRA